MGPLTSGQIVNKAKGIKENYTIAKLYINDLDKLIQLQKIILKNMDRSDLYVGLTVEEFEYVLCDYGVSVGAFVEGELVGFYIILFPGDSQDNLGKDIGIPRRQLSQVAHLEAAGVRPDYRGNSLQKIMTRICLEQALKLKQIKYLCVTISPYNYPSMDHMFAFGLYIRDLRRKYGDRLRYICSRNMDDRQQIITDSIVEIEISSHIEQLRLLQQGYVGFRLMKMGEKDYISFGRLDLNSRKRGG